MPAKAVKRLMVPSELVAEISEMEGVPKAHVSATLRGLRAVVASSVKKGVTVSLGKDFGKFVAYTTAKRKHFVPSVGGQIKAGGNKRLKFVVSSLSLKRII